MGPDNIRYYANSISGFYASFDPYTFVRSQQRHPKSFLLDYNAWFDYLANVPESQHAGLMLFSDHATPVGWRFMSGYGVHTFRWVNNEGNYVFVKVRKLTLMGRSSSAITCRPSITGFPNRASSNGPMTRLFACAERIQTIASEICSSISRKAATLAGL